MDSESGESGTETGTLAVQPRSGWDQLPHVERRNRPPGRMRRGTWGNLDKIHSGEDAPFTARARDHVGLVKGRAP